MNAGFDGTWESCLLVLLVSLILVGCAGEPPASTAIPRLKYPESRRVEQFDEYHGEKVADPYRWLEDDHSAETKAWVEAQNRITFGYLEAIPSRAAIKERLTHLWNFERFGLPFREGGRYFFSKNNGLQNQNVLLTTTSLEAEPTVLLDPNGLSRDGTIALSSYSISRDGKLMAYGLAKSGSDWQEFRVRDIDSGRDREDLIQWVRWSGVAWKKDGSGFFYSRFDEPKPDDELKGQVYFQKLYFHQLGAAQSSDLLIYHRPDQKEWTFLGDVTDDGRFLIITVHQGTDTRNRLFYLDLTQPGARVVELLADFDASYHFVDNEGPVLWFQTDLRAPRGRIIAIDTLRPARAEWREIVPESAETMVAANVVGQRLVVDYLKDARTQVKIFSLKGAFEQEVALPGIGTAGGFGGKRDETETFYSFTSFNVPGRIYRYDLTTGASSIWREPKVDFKPEDFETHQVFYSSKDGTRVPMFITHKKGLSLDGRNPTLLYGYGGFNISLTPTFSVGTLVWMEMGGVYAVPNLRGGGEYGEAWHQAGTKLRKQNVFDDFIAAAEWLIGHRYTSPQHLAIFGGSNGGLLVGACLNQRPELFRAAIPAVGVMDMLRFHQFTGGWAWKSDYGDVANADEYRALHAYSPYHQLRPGVRYPATLITTADHDDRVVPAHSFKYAARLQECQSGGNPVLIRIDTKAGHGGGKPTAKLIEETTDRWSFLVRELGLQPNLRVVKP